MKIIQICEFDVQVTEARVQEVTYFVLQSIKNVHVSIRLLLRKSIEFSSDGSSQNLKINCNNFF